ncbi:NADPH-flavin oxidoreductase [compost metagenome]
MCVGYPDQENNLRPRLPIDAVLHRNKYVKEQMTEHIETYDETTKHYMLARTSGMKDTPWSQLMASRLAQPSRLQMREYLVGKGFMKK